MELSLDETDVVFNLTLEDELHSIDRLIEQANEFLYEFNTPPPNSTMNSNDSSSVNAPIVDTSESVVEVPLSLPPQQTPQRRLENRRPDQNGDDDVIFLDLQNPTVVDYIDLCSPSPMHNTDQRGTKRCAKVRRYTADACNTVTDCHDVNVDEEPQDKRAKEITCRICFESLFDRVTMSTACGHMFCKTCLDQVLKLQKKCPMCKHPLNKNRVFRIFL